LTKGVPLTNANIIETIRGVIVRGQFTKDDVIMAALPPFHSFGFTGTVVVPLLYGIRCVYFPNPTAFFDVGR
jgi:acyl-CoA synthetase (AMP-forming)/AMP-acid ligase II